MLRGLPALPASRVAAALLAVVLSGAPGLVPRAEAAEHRCPCQGAAGEHHRCSCPFCRLAALRAAARDPSAPPCHRVVARECDAPGGASGVDPSPIRSRCHTSPPWPAAAWSWAPPSARRPRAPRTPSRAASPEVPSLLTRGGRGPGPPPFASRSAEDLHPSHGGRETGTCSCPSGILTPPLPGCAVRQGSPARIVPSSPRWRWRRCSRHRPRAPARCVGCGCPLLASSDPAAINGGLRLQLDAEYLRIDAGTDDRPGYTDQLTQWSYRLNAVYRPIPDLALSATVPLVRKVIRTVGGGVSVEDSSLDGLGDVEVAARCALWTGSTSAAGACRSWPSRRDRPCPPAGTTPALRTAAWSTHSASWAPAAGGPRRPPLPAGASVSCRVRTQATYFDHSRCKFGDAALWSVHGQYRPVQRLALDLGLDGRYARADRAVDPDGTVTSAVGNTGGSLLSLAPGVYLRAAGQLWLFTRAQVPVHKRLLGEQDVKPSFSAGLQYQMF